MTEIKKTDIAENAEEAKEQTGHFTDHEDVGETKSPETTDDVSDGMPDKNAETLDETTKTG